MHSRLPSETPLQTMKAGGETLPHPATQISRMPPLEAYTDGRLEESGGVAIAPTLRGGLQYQDFDGERSRLLRGNGLSKSPPAMSDMPPAGDVQETFDTSPTDSSQLSTFGAALSRVLGDEPRGTQTLGGKQQQKPNDSVLVTSYPFLDTDFITNLPPESLEYLEKLGCLQLPPWSSLNELVRAYFLYAHPHLPLIDEGEFREIYLADQSVVDGTCRMSLLVFQAMLLVACSVS